MTPAVDLSVREPSLIPTIFHEPWWLDIVCGGRFRIAEVSENGRIIGRLPYFLHHRYGVTQGIMPPLTHFLGPAIAEGKGTPDARFLKRLAVTEELIDKLPRTSSFRIKCHRGVTDVIAFQRKQFRTAVQFTHEIAPQPINELWDNLHPKRRGAISRAEKRLSPGEVTDLEEFFRFNVQNLAAHGLKSDYDLNVFRKLVEACLERRQGRILGLRDDKDVLHAATFCVWDQTSYYFLMGTRAPESFRGSMSLLAWEAVKDSVQRKIIFDLDGLSSNESVSFYSGFGAVISPRYIVLRETVPMRIARSFQSIYKQGSFYF